MTGFELALAVILSTREGLSIEPDELVCLTRNIYHEARGESREGQIAIAYVTLNRVHSEEFGETICEVVYSAEQFAWTDDDLPDDPEEKFVYTKAMVAALDVIRGSVPDPTLGATYFYNPDHADPFWSRRFAETATIGGHRFMRE